MPGCQLCGGDHAVGPEGCPELRLHETIAGKYVIESLLGCGGICAVYAAHHKTLRRDIALKVVHKRFARDAELGARFVREARETAAIGHPAFVPVFDAGIAEDGCAYIEMDRLDGRDLYAIRTDDGPLAPERAVTIAIDVLDALEALARARHHPPRPQELEHLRRRPGEKRPRCSTSGSPRSPTSQASTAPNQLLGTPFYISPEQLFDPRSVDARADLFALGVVMFEVLTGDWPYAYEGKNELLRRVMKGEIERHPAARDDRSRSGSITWSRVRSRSIARTGSRRRRRCARRSSAGSATEARRAVPAAACSAADEYEPHARRAVASRRVITARASAHRVAASAPRAHSATRSRAGLGPSRIATTHADRRASLAHRAGPHAPTCCCTRRARTLSARRSARPLR